MRPEMLRNRQLSGGLTMFFFQFLVQAGIFFVVPLYLSVCLGLSALGDRRAAAAALGHAARGRDRDPAAPSERLAAPRRPRRAAGAARSGRSSCSPGSTRTRGRRSCSCRCSSIGLGIGALASQLGAVTVSAVPDERSPEVGGIQNTMTNLGASLGHGDRRLDPDRAPSRRRSSSNIQQSSAHPGAREGAGAGRDRRRRAVRLRRRPGGRRSTRPASARGRADAALDAYQDARLDGLRAALAILAAPGALRALRRAAHSDDPTRCSA